MQIGRKIKCQHWSDWQDAGAAVVEHTMEESHTIKWEEVEVVNHHPRHRQRCALEDWTEWHKMNRDTKVYAPSVQLTGPPIIFTSPTDFVGEHPLLYLCQFTLPTVVAMLITS